MIGACPPTELLLDFAAGRVSDDSQASVEAHIDSCATCRTTLSSLAKDEVPSTAFGRYRLETVLGSGGMGIVYRAWDPQLARPVAIKVVRQAGNDAALRTRLVREAQALARLSHPNVCQVYDVDTEGEEVWVAMELIDGTTLRQWTQATRTTDELLEVLIGAAEGIAAAHGSELIHRDIKPENVLVTRTGRPVVTDFGLARGTYNTPVDPSGSTVSGDPLLTATGAIAGTPAYLAPEQLTGAVLDARVDQFAWAVMAWELLTGVRPFPIIAAIRLDAIRAGVTAPATLPRPIAAALSRAMAVAPRDRFPTMRDLIEALRARPARRRTRTPLLVAGAAVLAVGATMVGWRVLRTSEPAAAASPTTIADTSVPQPTVVKTDPDVTPDPIAAPDAAPEPTATAAEPGLRGGSAAHVGAAAIKPRPTVPKLGGGGSQAATLTPVPMPPAPAHNPTMPFGRTFSPTLAYATLVSWCHVPIDPKQPDPALGRSGVIDWGHVTRREVVTATLVDRQFSKLLYEVRGQRATYQFDGDRNSIGILDVPVGQLVALCIDPMRSERSDIYGLPGWPGGLDLIGSVLPITAPPRVAELGSLAPLHVDDGKLRAAGDKGKLQLAPSEHYLVQAKVEAADGDRWDMGRWWLEVPKVRGANLVGAGKRLWFVIDAPAFEDQGEGRRPRLVARAAMVLDEVFPH